MIHNIHQPSKIFTSGSPWSNHYFSMISLWFTSHDGGRFALATQRPARPTGASAWGAAVSSCWRRRGGSLVRWLSWELTTLKSLVISDNFDHLLISFARELVECRIWFETYDALERATGHFWSRNGGTEPMALCLVFMVVLRVSLGLAVSHYPTSEPSVNRFRNCWFN